MKKRFLIITILAVLALSVSACGNNVANVSSSAVENKPNSEDSHEVETIMLETDNGILSYKGYEFVGDDFYNEIAQGDASKTIILKFDYTNKNSKPSGVQQEFSIKAYQNGAELSGPSSWGKSPEILENFYNGSAMKDSTIEIGRVFLIKDYSPISIMSEAYSNSDMYQMMEIEIENKGDSSTTGEATGGAEEAKAEFTEISLGQTVSSDLYDFTLNNVEFTYELLPPNTSSVYTSYPADAGKVYIHIDGTCYNKGKRAVCVRDLPSIAAVYDDGYAYAGFNVVDDDNRFTWVSSYIVADPLVTCHTHGLIECPEVVYSSDAPVYVIIVVGNTNYKYTIR